MKTKPNLIQICLLCAAMLPTAVQAQTNQYLYTGSETNITLVAGTYIITAYGAQGGCGYDTPGGLGAEMEGEFTFSGPTALTLLVGGIGSGIEGYNGSHFGIAVELSSFERARSCSGAPGSYPRADAKSHRGNSEIAVA